MNVLTPPGLGYRTRVLDLRAYEHLYDWMESEPIQALFKDVGVYKDDKQKYAVSRQTIQYGKMYDYETDTVYQPAPSGLLPELIASLTRTLCLKYPCLAAPDSSYFDHCTINKYLPGAGIPFHIDSACFSSPIVCFTLGSPAEMEFIKQGEFEDQVCLLYAQPNSVYWLQGEAREKWEHGMRHRTNDPGHGKRTGPRYSITLRHVIA